MYLTREQLLGKCDRRYMDVPLPSGGTVRIQSLSEGEKGRFEAGILNSKTGKPGKDKLANMRQRLIVACVVDAKGDRVLGDNDVKLLDEMDGRDADAIYAAAQDHLGFEQGDIEKLIKNSETTPADDSPTN